MINSNIWIIIKEIKFNTLKFQIIVPTLSTVYIHIFFDMYHSMIYIFFDGSGNPPTFMILPHDLFISQHTKKEEDIED